MARCIIFASEIPFHFRVDAVEYAAYSLNVPLQMLMSKFRSPMKELTEQFSSLGEIVNFESPFTVYRHYKKKNITPRGQKEIIIGIGEETKGYRVYLLMDKVAVLAQYVCKMSRH